MRFALSQRNEKITISAKRNNWRPKRGEIELPDCLDHVARDHLKTVGSLLTLSEDSPTYRLLLGYLRGEDPESAEIEKVASRLMDDSGLVEQIRKACGRMRRKGLDNPDAPLLIAGRFSRLLKERV